MLKNILSLSKKFIFIKSVEGNPKALGDVLELALLELKDFTIERFERDGVKSALVYKSEKRPKKFKILLNAHLDVIPAKDTQYTPRIIGNKLYGAGSMDMKANTACMIFAFKDMATKVDYPLGLQLVTDEEIGGFNGTKYQVEKGIRADFVLAGEPTNFDIVHKAKGVLKLNISTKGLTAHGAYPWKGENAIWKMNEFLSVLKNNFPIPISEKWVTTINLSKIETSNLAFNKIPDDCKVSLDIRYISEDSKTILKNIKDILPRGFKLEVLVNEPAVFTDKSDKYLIDLQKITKNITGSNVVVRGAHGTSDVNHFSKVGCAGIEFGPIGGGIGSDKEWVDIKSLETFYKILKEFIKNQD